MPDITVQDAIEPALEFHWYTASTLHFYDESHGLPWLSLDVAYSVMRAMWVISLESMYG